jgi:hypothetical protein
MSPTISTSNQKSRRERKIAAAAVVGIASILVAARYLLFEYGVLYGAAIANMASLAVAGIIVIAGCLSLWIVRGRSQAQGGSQPQGGGAGADGVVATVAAVLALALTGYSVSEIVAPNTPVAASVAACAGVPVYGAKYFAVTAQDGVNSRSGPGPEYRQLNHYPTGCTLGFDGYCVGFPETDFIAGTPDQRWLLVHERSQLISAAVVISESAESDLGTAPDPRCPGLGGSPQPDKISNFTYNTHSGELSATAPGAVLVGYSAVSLNESNSEYAGTISTNSASSFSSQLSPAKLIGIIRQPTGQVVLASVICLAVNVPVTNSLTTQIIAVKNGKIVAQKTSVSIQSGIKERLAEFACNAG